VKRGLKRSIGGGGLIFPNPEEKRFSRHSALPAIFVAMVQRQEEPDLAVVERFFAERGLVAKRIPQATEKTPDFKIIRNVTVVSFCEVKSPQDVFQERLTDAIRQAPEGRYGGVVRSGTVSRQYLCMERAAKKAAAQFNAANASHTVPNIVLFVNHDTTSHQGDFEEAVTGCFGGIRTGKSLREEIAEIDAYVWLNANKSKPLMFWQQNSFSDTVVSLLKA
jgi:hypothetical protein